MDIWEDDQESKALSEKSIGKNCLTFDELHTLLVDVAAILNSHPLT